MATPIAPQKLPTCFGGKQLSSLMPYQRTLPTFNISTGLFVKLVLNRFLRDRGGLQVGESINLFVCIREPGIPAVDYTEFTITNDPETERRPNAEYMNFIR